MSHKPGIRLPLLSARPAVPPVTLKGAATNFAAWWTEAQWVWTVCLRLVIWTRAFCAWVQHANHSATEPPFADCTGVGIQKAISPAHNTCTVPISRSLDTVLSRRTLCIDAEQWIMNSPGSLIGLRSLINYASNSALRWHQEWGIIQKYTGKSQ